MNYKGILIDRDGVLLENRADYVKNIDEVRFIPGVVEAIARLWSHDYRICVVTNQAGIAKGLYTERTLESIHAFIEREFHRYGHGPLAWYFCPHRDDDGCQCRKPLPGMLIKAMHDHRLSPCHTWMIGDNKRDIQAGASAGCKNALVRTGLGRLQSFADDQIKPEVIVPDFSTFVDFFLESEL